MNMRFSARGGHGQQQSRVGKPLPSHQVTSGFSYAQCRFTLDCSCGAHADTPYIDEALEWREMHEQLAPLSDQLGS
ncbi:MAG: hypothetical protein ACOYO9_04500 [Candidatus Nanopelagicales bacterium]|jgi:hypothetical protein